MDKAQQKKLLRDLDNWEVTENPSSLQGISKRAEDVNTENFFNRKKKKWLLLWGTILILIIFIALKSLLNISLVDFFRNLGTAKDVPYFLATILFGLSTFFVCEVVIRVYIIKLKLGERLKNISKFEWFNFSIVSFLIQSITPFSIGSEPYNIWWLTKKGVPAKDATAATAVSSICWFISQFLVTWPSFLYLTWKNWDKVVSHQMPTCYWFVLVGLLIDIVIFIFIFTISYVSKAHFFISKMVNDVKRYFGMPYLTRDELFQKYLQDSTFKNLYVRYLLDVSTIKVIVLYFISNVWVYMVFALSHRLFFSNVHGTSYWDDVTSTWNSYHLINVSTTANNFLPLPSSEGSLQVVLQQMMKEMSSIGTAVNGSGKSLEESKVAQLNDLTIFLWRFFCKYLGLFISLTFIFLFGFNPRRGRNNQLYERAKKFRNLRRDSQTSHELVF